MCLQAIDEAAERTACNSSRSRVESHPVQARQGVLWLWGRGGSEEFVHSAAKELPIAPEAEDPAWFSLCAPLRPCLHVRQARGRTIVRP